jgi:ADP-heptose:LPS heptosyltransferase
LFILIFLKKQFEGSKIDKYIRYIFNFFATYYYKLSKEYQKSHEISFAFICYGGLGDCILTIPFLNELSSKYPLTVFIDKQFSEIDNLLNDKIQVMKYSKNNLFKELKLFSSLKSNFILVQQSPIMEFMLFHHFLKRPPTLGYIYNQNSISSEGITLDTKNVKSVNKIIKYNKLLERLFCIENINKVQIDYNYINDKLNILTYKKTPKKKYYILSPTKNHLWEMGFLDFKIYAELIKKLSTNFNAIPVIIGTKNDSFIISKIMKHIPRKFNIINLGGKTTIKELIPILIKSEFVIANDNGIHHLSNFLKIRTLTLFNFSSFEVYNWSNKQSQYIFNPIYDCMPCIGKENGPFDNYPFKCPWQVRCKKSISANDILIKLGDLKWIN